ncbi:hypothetical protein BKA56DRAFT_635610 [Ilyonectria sp. MPI-CAGE-AT-0026]|nr:hypothetical protein BKA56DRAFT_635610 [Ilyonectria sp. MPI-CAGE-AT-0026]
MGSNSLPSPPAEDSKSTLSARASQYRRASSSATTNNNDDHVTHSVGMNRRRKRCDGEFPCKRCKDDGSVCTAAVRKKMEYKQLPQGYAEVLENTQFVLIATVHKLYSMVLNNQPWELGQPEMNDRGHPVIHNIAQKLGCIRPHGDIDLPAHSVFPEGEAGMADLARQLEEQQKQKENGQKKEAKEAKEADFSLRNQTERAPSSELDRSVFEYDCREAALGNDSMTLSPQSFIGSTSDFESAPITLEINTTTKFPPQLPLMPNFPAWSMAAKPQPSGLPIQFLQQTGAMGKADVLCQSLFESEFGTTNPHVPLCPSSEVMMGMGDPMVWCGYDGERPLDSFTTIYLRLRIARQHGLS